MRPIPRAMPALVTPFTEAGDLDLEPHRGNVGVMWERGMRGILVAGSTGEGPYLEPGDREALVAAAREAAPDAFILCGVHAETTRIARRGLDEAAEGGADAALVVTPTTLVRHRPDLIEAFFDEIADHAPLPLMLYSVPKVTGVELAEESVTALAQRGEFAGMKDSGGDPARAGRMAAAAPDGFTLFAGASAAVAPSVQAGAYGAITASANYAAALVAGTVSTALEGDAAATDLQARLSAASVAIERFGIPGVKQAASRTGISPGHSRSPLRAVDAAATNAINEALLSAGLA